MATFLGLAAILYWPIGLIAAGVWLLSLALTRYSSVSGMLAGASAPLSAALLGRFDLSLLFLGIASLIVWKHRANIDRLMAGTEPRVGEKRKA